MFRVLYAQFSLSPTELRLARTTVVKHSTTHAWSKHTAVSALYVELVILFLSHIKNDRTRAFASQVTYFNSL